MGKVRPAQPVDRELLSRLKTFSFHSRIVSLQPTTIQGLVAVPAKLTTFGTALVDEACLEMLDLDPVIL